MTTEWTDDDDPGVERWLDEKIAQRPDLDAHAFPECGVYFILCARLVKIGVASSIHRRFAELCRVIPIPLCPLGWIACDNPPAAFALERVLHQRFAPFRTTGEWFVVHPALELYLQAEAAPWPWKGAPRAGA
jgi:Meiotically Up-regulated Gene 113 (MUG113) protein